MTRVEIKPEPCGCSPAERLHGLSPYEPPTTSPLVDLVLDANEGAAPCEALAALLSSIDAEELRRYPSTSELERVLADKHGIDAERVVVTNGADDAIDRVCRAVLEPGRAAVLHCPTFEMIERSARLADGEVRSVEWLDGTFPAQECVGEISRDTSLVALVSPNNPTGAVIPLADMVEVARASRRADALVLVDLAYVEFADEDPTRELLDEPNVVVIRTFSKAMGLAGARVGYALAPPDVARWLRTTGGPYPVSAVSVALAVASLRSADERALYINTVRSGREALTSALRQLDCEVLDSHANFVTARFPGASFVQDSLSSLGIAVRAFAPSRPELDGFLRITLPGDQDALDRLIAALRTILAPEAVLFDLDASAPPTPEALQRVLGELGVGRAWMIGDTPDAMAASRAAGMLPIGLIAPEDDTTKTRDAMRRAGAALVIGEVSQIGEMIR
ncbi:MAG: aminotransferase class I/II-fold pyridoxal phosphate-dependent enzyme [Phycisphaerales bacterium JB043]